MVEELRVSAIQHHQLVSKAIRVDVGLSYINHFVPIGFYSLRNAHFKFLKQTRLYVEVVVIWLVTQNEEVRLGWKDLSNNLAVQPGNTQLSVLSVFSCCQHVSFSSTCEDSFAKIFRNFHINFLFYFFEINYLSFEINIFAHIKNYYFVKIQTFASNFTFEYVLV